MGPYSVMKMSASDRCGDALTKSKAIRPCKRGQ